MCAFISEEEANDENFSRQLAALCDGLFVCDAFGSAHRAHASVVGITRFVKQAAAGLLMESELAYLGKAISNPERPFVAILGGAKVSDKIEVVENLMKSRRFGAHRWRHGLHISQIAGLPVGKSLVENDKLGLAAQSGRRRQASRFRVASPRRSRRRGLSKSRRDFRNCRCRRNAPMLMGLDIGPKTVALFSRGNRASARTIVWNGPMGMFENPAFAARHAPVAKAVADATIGGSNLHRRRR